MVVDDVNLGHIEHRAPLDPSSGHLIVLEFKIASTDHPPDVSVQKKPLVSQPKHL